MGAALRERQIERAWREHEPERARVPPEARRAAQAFRERIAPGAERFNRIYLSAEFRRTLNDWSMKGPIGRERALCKIKQLLAPAVIDVMDDALLFTWLQPHDGFVRVDHPTFAQSGVIVAAAHISRAARGVRDVSFPIVEIPEHALARMVQRSPAIDMPTALHEAARAFLAADAAVVDMMRLGGRTVYLPAGRGLLLSFAIRVDLVEETQTVARANTWISMAQAQPDQRPLAPAADPARSVLAAAVS
jgi:hypothetical protein